MNNWNSFIINILDILIISLFVYSLLLFIKRIRSYRVFLGGAITLSLYVFAKFFNLQLTLWVLQYVVGASVVLFAIIFQSELRKYLELIGLIGSRQFKVTTLKSKSPAVAEIVQSCVKMAQNKIGALLVIQGKDNLDAYIEGGNTLDGLISEEIILSIFDKHSLGHDGAVIISNNRISKFGTHLPLSTNFKEIGKHGTRHAAALGLSENSDALCVVVSEENGSISFCRDGKLKTLTEFSNVEKELNKFINAKFTPQAENIWMHVLKHNSRLKISAIALSVIIWLISRY